MDALLEEFGDELKQLNSLEYDDGISSQDRLSTAIKLAQIMSMSGASAIRTGDMLRHFLSKIGFEDVSVKVFLSSVAITVRSKDLRCGRIAVRHPKMTN